GVDTNGAWQLGRHAHPLRSGGLEQRICHRLGAEQTAVEDAAKEVKTPGATIEPIAELVQVGLQVSR
ncbi:MAG: hypothetical protein ACOX8V_06000, partial [Thermoleophilia bacterium]